MGPGFQMVRESTCCGVVANCSPIREKEEAYLNTFPQFMAKMKDDDGTHFDVHFMALFSQKPNAIPISFLHGWPGLCLTLQART